MTKIKLISTLTVLFVFLFIHDATSNNTFTVEESINPIPEVNNQFSWRIRHDNNPNPNCSHGQYWASCSFSGNQCSSYFAGGCFNMPQR